MEEFHSNFKPESRNEVLFKELNDCGVLYKPESEKIHSLNVSVHRNWKLEIGERNEKNQR